MATTTATICQPEGEDAEATLLELSSTPAIVDTGTADEITVVELTFTNPIRTSTVTIVNAGVSSTLQVGPSGPVTVRLSLTAEEDMTVAASGEGTTCSAHRVCSSALPGP